jgi:hypothetical protein
LAGGNNITLSQNGNTITISQLDPVLNQLFWPQDWQFANFGSTVVGSVYSLEEIIIPAALSFTEVDIPVNFAANTAANTSSAYYVQSATAVLYSLSNFSTLNPIVGAFRSDTLSWQSNTASQVGSYTGLKLLSFALATQLTQGTYYLGVGISSSSGFTSGGGNTTALGASLSVYIGQGFGSVVNNGYAPFGSLGITSSNLPLGGLAVTPSATNNTYHLSIITMTGTAYARAELPCIFRNI